MKKIKILSAILTSALALSFIPVFAGNVSAASDVAINEKNFPDKVFRKYVKEKFDTNKDNKLSSKEIAKAEEVVIWYDVDGIVKSLQGVEYLTALEDLQIYGHNLKKLDLSKNTKLKWLACQDGLLSELDLSKNTALLTVDVPMNKLTSLNISKNVNLVELNCWENNLTKLDVSKNIQLERLACRSNKLTSLDVTKNTKLDYLDCSANSIKSLDLTKSLKELYCYDNNLSTLNLSNMGKLKSADWINQANDFSLLLRVGQKLKGYQEDTFKSQSTDVFDIEKKVTTEDGYEGYILLYNAKKVGTAVVKNENNDTIATVKVLYKDVTDPGKFWFEPTYYLSDIGVVKGYDNQTKFKPDNECSRAQMVTFLWRLAGSPNPKAKTSDFTDIKSSDYYYKAVIWAVENGITTGTSKTTFGPDKICTRAQTVTFLWRMAGKPEPKSTKAKFTDVKTTDYFFKATLWASEKKILAGYSDGTFKPKDNCLRRQMVTFLYKYDMYVNEKGNTGPKI